MFAPMHAPLMVKIQNISITPEVSLMLFNMSTPLQCKHYTTYIGLVLPVLELHINGM